MFASALTRGAKRALPSPAGRGNDKGADRKSDRLSDFDLIRFARLLEHQDGAGDFTRLHRAERLVDIFQLAAARDHAVEIEPALLVELDDARHIDAEAIGSHEASLDALLE